MIYKDPSVYENTAVVKHNFRTLTYNLIEPNLFDEFVLKVQEDESSGLILIGFYCRFKTSAPLDWVTVARIENLNNTRNTNFTLVNETGDKFAYLQLAPNGYIRITTWTQNVDAAVLYILISPGITLDV